MDVFAEIEAFLARRGGAGFSVHQGKLYANPDLLRVARTLDEPLIAPEVHSKKGGEVGLRREVARCFLGTADAAERVVLCNGGTNGLSLAFAALVTPERRHVHVLSPFWMYLPGVIRHAGGTFSELATVQAGALVPRAELLRALGRELGARSACVYLATPANPVGDVPDTAFLQQLLALCEEHGIHLVVDHAYYGFDVEEARSPRLAPMAARFRDPRVVNVFTFSKLYGVPGLRLGFACASAPLVARMAEMYRYTSYTPNSFSQAMVYHLLQQADILAERRRMYLENLAVARQHLGELCVLPEGGFFAFLYLKDRTAKQTLLEHGVGVVDGGLFGATYDAYARLCFTAEPAPRLEACCTLIRRLTGK